MSLRYSIATILITFIGVFCIFPAIASAEVRGYWAHPKFSAPIYKESNDSSFKKSRLHLFTEDGFPEVYKVFKEKIVDGVNWVMIGMPARPNGQRGWVKSYALGKIHKALKELRINRSNFTAKLWLFKDGKDPKIIWKARVGVGAPGTETPKGDFWIRERINGFDLGTIYGPIAFGTSAYSVLSDWPGGGVVGIHGTNEPGLIPGAVSHGCIRLHNKKVKKLSKHLKIGTPVIIK